MSHISDEPATVKGLRDRVERAHAPSSLVPVHRHELEAVLDYLGELKVTNDCCRESLDTSGARWSDDYTGIGDMPTLDLVKLLYLDWENMEREGRGDVARHTYEAARRLRRAEQDFQECFAAKEAYRKELDQCRGRVD